ncbi:hypothetical protein MKW94_024484, partial [Papaver nudicaule]|nr:hypothetical protein [Papaver nudicaule]
VVAISEQASGSDEEPLDNPASGMKFFDMRSVVSATEDLFHFILSEKGWRVRVFLVQDIIRAADVFLQDEILPRVLNEKFQNKDALDE